MSISIWGKLENNIQTLEMFKTVQFKQKRKVYTLTKKNIFHACFSQIVSLPKVGYLSLNISSDREEADKI